MGFPSPSNEPLRKRCSLKSSFNANGLTFVVGKCEGKAALVIDRNRGIGMATALAFAQGGAQVVIAARRVDAGRQTVAEIRRTTGRAEFVQTDATQATEGESLIRRTGCTFGRLDCAFNNAGIGSEGLLHEWTEADWDRLMDTNVKGVWLCAKYQIAQMLVQGVGAPRWTIKRVEVDGKAQRGR